MRKHNILSIIIFTSFLVSISINSLSEDFKVDTHRGEQETVKPSVLNYLLEWVIGPPSNFIGKNSNWIGIDRSGKHFAKEYERDELDRRPLGNTTMPGLFPRDEFARQHDIQDWVNWHSHAGSEVRVEGPDGRVEYYTSQGTNSGKHNWWVIGRWFGFGRGDDLWRPTAKHPERVIQLDDLRKQFPINNNPNQAISSEGEVHIHPFYWKKDDFPPPPPPPPPPPFMSGRGGIGGVEMDPQPSSAGKGGSDVRDQVLKSRPSPDSLSWPIQTP